MLTVPNFDRMVSDKGLFPELVAACSPLTKMDMDEVRLSYTNERCVKYSPAL